MALPTEYIEFPTREARSVFVAERFDRYLHGTVLDVGCFEAPLRDLLEDASYTGVDIAGRPDIELNLETVERLPFDDGSFDTVTCIEVLEHLDNLHDMFAELVRVSARHVIISLPNCWNTARRRLEQGRGKIAHLGLPVERPVNRHKWFFNTAEARDFLRATAKEQGVVIEELFTTEKPRSPLLRGVRKIRYPGERYQNLFTHTIWVLLRKERSGDGAK